MKNLRSYRAIMRMTDGILHNNPVLIGGLALPVVIMGSTSLKNAVALCISCLITLLPLMLLASTAGKQIPKQYRVTLYVLLASAILCIASDAIRLISPGIFESLGIYYSLMAVNTIMLTRLENVHRETKPLTAFLDGLRACLGFALVMLLVAFIREYFGSATVWGVPHNEFLPMRSVSLPFFGFILVGFFCAAAKYLDRMIKTFLYRSEFQKRD